MSVEVAAGEEGTLFLRVVAPRSVRIGTRHALRVRVATVRGFPRDLRITAHVVPDRSVED